MPLASLLTPRRFDFHGQPGKWYDVLSSKSPSLSLSTRVSLLGLYVPALGGPHVPDTPLSGSDSAPRPQQGVRGPAARCISGAGRLLQMI